MLTAIIGGNLTVISLINMLLIKVDNSSQRYLKFEFHRLRFHDLVEHQNLESAYHQADESIDRIIRLLAV